MKKSIGLDVEPPKEKCQDLKCPWHGRLPVRGRSVTASIKSSKAPNTSIVEWNYTKFIPKYERYERRKSKLTVQRPSCIKVKDGDTVVIAECRPLSKTKSFVIVGFPGGKK